MVIRLISYPLKLLLILRTMIFWQTERMITTQVFITVAITYHEFLWFINNFLTAVLTDECRICHFPWWILEFKNLHQIFIASSGLCIRIGPYSINIRKVKTNIRFVLSSVCEKFPDCFAKSIAFVFFIFCTRGYLVYLQCPQPFRI